MDDQTIICTGCGVPLQTENQDEPGYVPASAFEKEAPICRRCFRLKHYNEIEDVSLTDDDFLKILNQIGESQALVVKIVDIFDFTGSWLPGLHRFAGKNDILLVGNKVDLLPKSVNENQLIKWMQGSAKQLGLKPVDVLLMSAEHAKGVEEVARAIDEYRNGKDVYIVGCTNVGKSTFINRLIKHFSGDERFMITTSEFPGTTLNLIDFPLDDGRTLYDTPGIVNRQQMAHLLNKKELKQITPKKEIKPKVFQLNEGQTLFFGGLARLDYRIGGQGSLVCYMPNELHIHRTKLEKADALYENQLGEILQPPNKDREGDFPELVRHDFLIKEEKADIVFSGLGWVTVNGNRTNVSAYAPKGVGVSVRKSLI
jgi:ribosome biogenesis GTPase YqeH